MSTAPRRWTRRESEASESVLQEMMGVNVSTKKKVSFKSREPLRDDGGLDGSANGDLLETGSASSEVGGGGTTSKQSDVASTVPPPTGTPAAAHRDIGDSPRAELTVVGQRSLVYLLWLVGGVGLGLLCIYVAFGSVEFGDPLDSTNPRQMYCAMMCAIFWSGLATACYLSLVHELLIKVHYLLPLFTPFSFSSTTPCWPQRRLYADLELPTIPHLAVRFLSTPVVGGGVLFGTWVAIYQGYKTMLPFHGTLGAVVSLLVGSLYLWVTLLPKVYYVDRPALPRIVFFGTFGLIMGGVVVPIVIYWIVLVFYELAVKSGGIGSQIIVLLVFQVTKIALIQYEIWVFRAVLGPVSDSLCDMLAISIVSILHNSFFSVAVEASHDYVAVIVAILGNAVYASHRTLVLNYNVDFVRYAQVEILMPAWRRVRRAVWGASGGRATHLQQHQVRTVAVVGSSDEACSDMPSLTSSQAALALDEANRAYLVLQFLSWEVYKFIVPLM